VGIDGRVGVRPRWQLGVTVLRRHCPRMCNPGFGVCALGGRVLYVEHGAFWHRAARRWPRGGGRTSQVATRVTETSGSERPQEVENGLLVRHRQRPELLY